MDFNQDIDTDDPGRTIGNGVVVAYAVSVAAMTALAVFTDLAGDLALGVFAAMFLVLFAGDLWIQWADMNNYEKSGAASLVHDRATGDSDDGDAESVAAES